MVRELPEPFEFLFLQDAQKFCLQIKRDIANFVQEKRSVVGCLEAAHALRDGAGKGAFFVTEEFALQQTFGNCCAVQADERPFGSAAELVNETREKFFSRTGFPINNHSRIGGRHHSCLLQCMLQGRARSHDPVLVLRAIGTGTEPHRVSTSSGSAQFRT